MNGSAQQNTAMQKQRTNFLKVNFIYHLLYSDKTAFLKLVFYFCGIPISGETIPRHPTSVPASLSNCEIDMISLRHPPGHYQSHCSAIKAKTACLNFSPRSL